LQKVKETRTAFSFIWNGKFRFIVELSGEGETYFGIKHSLSLPGGFPLCSTREIVVSWLCAALGFQSLKFAQRHLIMRLLSKIFSSEFQRFYFFLSRLVPRPPSRIHPPPCDYRVRVSRKKQTLIRRLMFFVPSLFIIKEKKIKKYFFVFFSSFYSASARFSSAVLHKVL
jgi:hypothetical protein